MNMDRKTLEEYQLMEQRIQTKKDRIQRLKNMAAQVEHGVVRGSNHDFPYQSMSFHVSGYNIQDDEKRHYRIYNLTRTLEEDIKTTEQRRLEVEEFIEGITDMTDQLIFTYIYLEDMTQEQAARKLHMDQSQVSRRIAKYFQKMKNA